MDVLVDLPTWAYTTGGGGQVCRLYLLEVLTCGDQMLIHLQSVDAIIDMVIESEIDEAGKHLHSYLHCINVCI